MPFLPLSFLLTMRKIIHKTLGIYTCFGCIVRVKRKQCFMKITFFGTHNILTLFLLWTSRFTILKGFGSCMLEKESFVYLHRPFSSWKCWLTSLFILKDHVHESKNMSCFLALVPYGQQGVRVSIPLKYGAYPLSIAMVPPETITIMDVTKTSREVTHPSTVLAQAHLTSNAWSIQTTTKLMACELPR